EPVRHPRRRLRPARPQHPRRRRGGGTGQHDRRGADAGALPGRVLRQRRAAALAPRSGPGMSAGMGVLAPMTVRTTGERIAERFVTAIALGQFVPGQRLPTERELAAMLEVSRATVREAIARLAEAGYVRASSRMADLALHQAIAGAAHNPHLLKLSLSIRHDISFGFEAEPYSPEVRARALHQHPQLAQAVIDGDPGRAAALAAEHF